MAICEECGSDSVQHGVEYVGAALDVLFGRFFVAPFAMSGGYTLSIFTLLSRLGLASLASEPDNKTLLLDQMLWHEAKRRGIAMFEFRPLGSVRNTFIAQLPSGDIIDFDGVPPLGKRPVWWVNNKSVMKERFRDESLPVPRGGSALTRAKALELFRALPKPVVVKPSTGSASRHTRMHIETEDELLHAFATAKRLSPSVSIEEEIPGAVYRPTLVDGKLIATLRRDQPHVVGDGVSTVEALVAAANTNPARHGPYFSPLSLDAAATSELAYQGLHAQSVPEAGRRVRLHQKINWALGGTTADVTDEVHPDNKALFERVAEVVKAPLLGIDFIIEDISKPWHEQRSGIIECNDMPYFDNHHLPFTGKPRDVAGPVWELALSTKRLV